MTASARAGSSSSGTRADRNSGVRGWGVTLSSLVRKPWIQQQQQQQRSTATAAAAAAAVSSSSSQQQHCHP
jgi:hypothetical protein